jgi:hypothetical protein
MHSALSVTRSDASGPGDATRTVFDWTGGTLDRLPEKGLVLVGAHVPARHARLDRASGGTS